jgi:hypothetical protein
VFDKIIKYLCIYVLLIFSFILFFTTLGYFIFVCDWGGDIIALAKNVFILIFLIITSIAIYYFAEKAKSRL